MKLLRMYMPSLILIFTMGCSKHTTMPSLSTTAPVIVYRTKADYSDYVPVGLSADGSRVVAYPSPSDLLQGDAYRYPISLKNKYYWDTQGVGPNTAFLTITYPEYAKLPAAPSPETLMANILDRNPFLEMYQVGKVNDYQRIEAELNEIIAQNRLSQYSSLLGEGKVEEQ